MGGVVKSVKNFAGFGDGPKVDVQNGNSPLDQLNQQGEGATRGYSGLNDYAMGKKSLSDVMGTDLGNANWNIGRNNELATGATTGSRFAADQLQNDPVYSGLFGKNGQLSKAESQLDDLNNQGFELKPEDMTLYGQTSGNISRLFGQQENATAQSLADRGLAAAPSGSAMAAFSGLQGNKNEQLARAQTQIMNQRVQDTMQRIGQTQNLMESLGGQYSNALQNQWQRQMAGAQNQHNNLAQAAGLQNQANAQANNSNLNAAGFEQSFAPKNVADFATAGMGQGIQAMSGGAVANMFGGGGQQAMQTTPMFGSKPGMGPGSGAMSGSTSLASTAALA